MEDKRFVKWIMLKEKLHNIGRLRTIREGEIWWCAMGENVGVEINGKHDVFSRPVLVFKKLSRYGFMGIPLTSQEHKLASVNYILVLKNKCPPDFSAGVLLSHSSY